jgi:cytochrome P450
MHCDSIKAMPVQTLPDPAAAALKTPVLRQIKDLPGPRAWPLVGNVLQLRIERVHQNFEALCKRFGPLFRVHFGRRPVLVIANHASVSAVLRERPGSFRRPSVTSRISAEIGGLPNVFNAEGADWRNQRRMVMAGFAPKPIRAYFPALVNVATRLQRRWNAAAATATTKGNTIDLSADLKRYTVDIIAGLAFGEDVNTLESGDNVIQQHLDLILPGISRRSLSMIPYWRYFKLPQDRKLERSSAALQVAVYDLIKQARQRMQADPTLRDKPSNLLEAMIAAADQPDSGVDNDKVAGNVSTMLLAGEDTTANSIAWLLHLLHRNPQALHSATEEVKRVAPDCAGFTIEQMDALVYLDAAIQEAMRLKPVGPFMPLEAVVDTTIEDVHVPKDSLVWCVLRHDTMDQKYFANPEAFLPERWLEPANNKHISTPFGSGPRMCPGRYLAVLEIKIAVAMVLAHYVIESVDTMDGNEAKELMGFVMSPVGLRMRLKVA